MKVGTWRATVGVLVGTFVTLTAASARADVVTEWNEQVFAIGGPQIQRTLALVHIAMFDAVNAIEPRYAPYLTLPQPPSGASKDAAAAAAARGVLVLLFPEQRAALDAALAASIRTVPDGPGKTSGLQYGDVVAQFIHGRRLTDRILQPGPAYVPGAGPGAYQLTGPSPVNTGAASWAPFALGSAAQFRPAGPPALTSAQFASDLEETRLLGGTVSGARTRDQDEIARFHSEQAQFQFNRIARAESVSDGEGVLKHARLFALLNMALADAVTAVFEAKYFYNFWRPVTAIGAADTDGNPATSADPTWTPFLPTPPHPEYPAAHAATQSAAAQVMNAYFGPNRSFRTTAPTAPGAVRSYANVDALVTEGRLARMLGGMHFRTSLEAGRRQGIDVGAWVLDHYLQPLD